MKTSMMESDFSKVPSCKLYTMQSMFPQKFKNSFFFGIFQNSCSNYLAGPIFTCIYKTQRLSCNIWFSFLRRCLPFHANLCKVTFDIPEAYLEPTQLSKMGVFFAKIVKGVQSITIFAKSSILTVWLGS